MTNENIFQIIRSFIVRIWSLGNTTYIYSDNGVNISVNSFVLTLSLMFIVLTSLVNIVKSRGSSSIAGINDSVRSVAERASKQPSSMRPIGGQFTNLYFKK